MSRGTDIHPFYQRGINWGAVQDIHFVWMKVSDGGAPYTKTVDGVTYRPDTLIAGAKARGFPTGGYCYAQPESKGGSPEHQADVLAAECRRLGAVDVVPMMDLEEAGTVSRNFGERSCNQLVARGFRPAVYMNASDAKAVRPDQWNVPGLVIVIARYGAKPEAPGSAQYLGRYDVHQYSSSGALPGSAGAVDLDESYTNTLLNPAHQEDDVSAQEIFWGTVFDTNGNKNYAQYIKDMSARLDGLVTALNAQTQIIVRNEANDITNEGLAAALQATLTAEVAPVVREAVVAALGEGREQEVDEIVDGVIAKTAAKLAAA